MKWLGERKGKGQEKNLQRVNKKAQIVAYAHAPNKNNLYIFARTLFFFYKNIVFHTQAGYSYFLPI